MTILFDMNDYSKKVKGIVVKNIEINPKTFIARCGRIYVLTEVRVDMRPATKKEVDFVMGMFGILWDCL